MSNLIQRLAIVQEVSLTQLEDARVGQDRLEMFIEGFDFTGKAPALVALHDSDDFGEFFLIPFLSRRLARDALPVCRGG